jgi:hypothetical protein
VDESTSTDYAVDDMASIRTLWPSYKALYAKECSTSNGFLLTAANANDTRMSYEAFVNCTYKW